MSTRSTQARPLSLKLLFSCTGIPAFAPANGNLQFCFMDVWQGDAAVLNSQLGEIVLIDDGAQDKQGCGSRIWGGSDHGKEDSCEE